MFEKYAELQKLLDEELIQEHDKVTIDVSLEYDSNAAFNQCGPRHYMSVLNQHHQTRQTEAILQIYKGDNVHDNCHHGRDLG